MTIEAGLVAYLVASIPTLKLFPQVAPETQAPPYSVYYRANTDRWRTFASEGQYASSFEISIYEATYGAMITTRNSIKGFLESKTGTLATGSPTVQAIEIDNETELYEADTKLHHGIIDITIYHN